MSQTTQKSVTTKNILINIHSHHSTRPQSPNVFPVDLMVIKDFFIYSFGSLLLKGSHYLVMPLIAFKLTTQEFGLLALINNFITIVTIFLGLGLRQVVSIEFFHHNSEEQKNLINEVITLYLVFATPCLLLMIIFLPSIKNFCFTPQTSTLVLMIALITCFMSFFNELFLQVLRYKSQSWLLTKIQLYAALISTTLKLFFLYVYSWTIVGILGGNFSGLCVIGSYGLYHYCKKMPFLKRDILFQKAKIVHYLKCGLPFIPSVLFSWVLASSDRWVLAQYTDLHHVGLYSFVDTFSQLFQLFILYPLIGAYFPHIIKQFVARPDDAQAIESKNRKIMGLIMCGSLFVTVLGYLIGKPLLAFSTPTKYHASLTYTVPLLLGQILLMGTNFLTCYIQYLKKIHYIVGLICIPATINIVLNLILVPSFKISGCVAATVVAYFCYFIFTWLAGSYLMKRELAKNNLFKHV